MSIFRALMPKRKIKRENGKLKNQRQTFKHLPDDLFNDAITCILTTNHSRSQNPDFPINSKYVFAICNNKPTDSEIFKWEEFPSLVKKEGYISNHKFQSSRTRKQLRGKYEKKKL